MKVRNLMIGTASYLVASFFVQALSHFVINTQHYASISFMRPEPLMYFGLLTMIIQGIVLTLLYLKWANNTFNVNQGLKFSLLVGLFFVSYLALVEPDKYNVINVFEWILVEGSAGLVQFTIFGVLLGKFIKN
ncbi:hypothetical protein [Roseivirga sp. E12]|uniref:hypothetical protein n=1 Tax=Roseivirga sp. E12 TaxID=2819237 RepID=UPI001ABC7C5E|nr:hypothetical protein [Roseivirga sp. E12]MBO3696845.1 hypothetical protein [Roseivirga sp. E12]